MNRYVRESELHGIKVNVVNYRAISRDPQFIEYIKQLETAKIDNLNRDETYAFYSNVYNALTIKMITDNPCKTDAFGSCGPIHSIRDIGLLPDDVFNKPAGVVGKITWSLNDIENYLRGIDLGPNFPKFPHKVDPRLHSSINCASISCPDLRIGAYITKDIDKQLTKSLNDFLSNEKKGMKVDRQSKIITLSKIFYWFKDDFNDGKVLDFILEYLDQTHTDYDFIKNNKKDLKIHYFDYDWGLNAEYNSIPCDSLSRPCMPIWAFIVYENSLYY